MAKFLTLDGLSYFLTKIRGIFVGAASDTTKGHVVTFGDDGKTIADSGFTIAASVPANAKFTDTTYAKATAAKDGLMAKENFAKLNGIAEGADVNVIESVKVNNTAVAVTDKAVNIDLTSYATSASIASTYAKKTDLTGYATAANIESTYAKKTDISGVYKYKGTKETYSALPTTGNTTGDVWNVTSADDEHGIKAGDNVAWDGTKWDNLSGVFVVPNITNSDIDGLFAS